MNNGSTAKKTRKPVSNNTKAKISKSVKNALNRNKAAAAVAGMSLANFRKMRKTATKKNGVPVAPNFIPMNNNFSSALNAAPTAATPGAYNPFNMFNMASVASANTKKANHTPNNIAKRAKMSNAQKKSATSASWQANVKKVKNMLGVSQKEAMVIASEKRKEKARNAKSKNNVNLLGFSNMSISNKKPSPAKANQNLMALYGM